MPTLLHAARIGASVSALTACAWFSAGLLGPEAMAQTVSRVDDLSFGGFLAAGGGTVSVGPTGVRAPGGAVILIAQGLGVTPARFFIHGTGFAMYSITLPDNNTVSLSDGAGQSMAVNNFNRSPSGTGPLPGSGTLTMGVGATLTVSPNQRPGSYSGTFTITVNYQ